MELSFPIQTFPISTNHRNFHKLVDKGHQEHIRIRSCPALSQVFSCCERKISSLSQPSATTLQSSGPGAKLLTLSLEGW